MTEQQYIKLICSLGCIITGRPAVPHHPRALGSAGSKCSDFLAIPLCPELHTDGPDSYHHDRAKFEMKYGREDQLLAKTIEAVVSHLSRERIPF